MLFFSSYCLFCLSFPPFLILFPVVAFSWNTLCIYIHLIKQQKHTHTPAFCFCRYIDRVCSFAAPGIYAVAMKARVRQPRKRVSARPPRCQVVYLTRRGVGGEWAMQVVLVPDAMVILFIHPLSFSPHSHRDAHDKARPRNGANPKINCIHVFMYIQCGIGLQYIVKHSSSACPSPLPRSPAHCSYQPRTH